MFQNKLVCQGIAVIGASAAVFTHQRMIESEEKKILEEKLKKHYEYWIWKSIYINICIAFTSLLGFVVVVVTVLIPFLKGTTIFKFGKGNW